MIDLNDTNALKALDPKDVYGSTGMLVDQCKQIWEESKNITSSYEGIENIVVCGMGGSAYGGYVIASLFKDKLKVPIYSNNDYHLPAFVDEKTLVVLSSYSGTTEEVLSCAQEAVDKKTKITGVTGGGKLGEILQTHNAPVLLFESKFNPSGQPRLGTGYMVLGMIALLVRLGLLEVSEEDAVAAIQELETSQEEIKKTAMDWAGRIYGNIPVIFAAEHLLGNIHIMRNQFNETAKSFSAFSPLPELNHHLMEGLKNPQDKKLHVLFIDSPLYSDKLKKRSEVTKDVVSKNNIEYSVYELKATSKLVEMLNVLSFGGYLSLYLAFLYEQDPSVIPWVDYFKSELQKSS